MPPAAGVGLIPAGDCSWGMPACPLTRMAGPVVRRVALIPILASLLASLQYQAYFTAEVERHLAGTLATASVRERLTALAAQLRPAMAAEAARWRPEQAPAAAVAQWEAALQRLAQAL